MVWLVETKITFDTDTRTEEGRERRQRVDDAEDSLMHLLQFDAGSSMESDGLGGLVPVTRDWEFNPIPAAAPVRVSAAGPLRNALDLAWEIAAGPGDDAAKLRAALLPMRG